MRTIHRDIVGAAIFSNNNKVLLGKTAKRDLGVYSGNWVAPGGGIEANETKLQALQREMLEETNIDVSSYEIKAVRTAHGQSKKKLKETGEIVLVDMTFYDYEILIHDKTAEQLGTEPTEELQTLAWFSSTELQNEQLSDPTRELLLACSFIK